MEAGDYVNAKYKGPNGFGIVHIYMRKVVSHDDELWLQGKDGDPLVRLSRCWDIEKSGEGIDFGTKEAEEMRKALG